MAKLPLFLAYPSIYSIVSSFSGDNDFYASNSVCSTVIITTLDNAKL